MTSGYRRIRKMEDQQLWTKLPQVNGIASAGVPAYLALSSEKCE
jgi:hypothetical protein